MAVSSRIIINILALWLMPAAWLFGQTFSNKAEELGIVHAYGEGASGGGVSFFDFNGDGWDDITLASGKGQKIHFYQNNQGRFELMASLVDDLSEVKQVLWVDYDNDGDKDFYITGYEALNRLYKNNGDLSFTDVTSHSGLSVASVRSYGAAWADFDRDGWIDLYVTNRLTGDIQAVNQLYRNMGDGTFMDISESSGTYDSLKRPFSISFVDINNDLYPDIYIAQDKKAGNTLLKNNQDGTFEDISVDSNADLVMDGMCVSSADIDRNGYFDIYITNIPEGNKLLMNNGNETFTESATLYGLTYDGYAWGSNFFDYNNDGDVDLYVCGMLEGSDQIPNILYTNDGSGYFEISENGFIGDTVISYSNGIGDIDNDGYLDIIVNNGFPYRTMLWHNSGGQNRWLKIRLEGILSNRDGIGSLIEVYANSSRQIKYTQCGVGYLAQNTGHEYFGLGIAEVVDSIIVHWPSGIVDRIYHVIPEQLLHIRENSSSLPPMIYHSLQSELCFGDSLVLSTGYYNDYQWNTGDTTRELVIRESGKYFVEVLDYNGQFGRSDTLMVNFLDAPKLTMTSNPSTSLSGNGSIEASVTGGHPPYDYTWTGFYSQKSNVLTGLFPGTYSLHVTDSKGCKVNGEIDVAGITDLHDPHETGPGFRIFPNPVKDNLTVLLTQSGKHIEYISVYDIAGKPMVRKIPLKGVHEVSLDISALREGLYILIIESSGSSYHATFLK